jgi:hypothetical protein
VFAYALGKVAGDLPVKREHLLEAMCQERHGLRLEVIQMESSMHRAVFLFVTVAATFAGIYWDKRVVPGASTRAALLFALSQFEWFLSILLVSLFSNQDVHVGYIRSLEEQINLVAGRPISLWDSMATKRYIAHPFSAFFWLSILIALGLAVLFGVILFVAVSVLKTTWFYILGAVEAGLVVIPGIWAILEIEWIQRRLRAEFNRVPE